jgi:iron complex transport system ATP-binding protein
MISIDSLEVTLSGKKILSDISIDIPDGRWSCLVGPNGAGKTTLLKVLLGTAPYSGSVKSDGVEVFRNQSRNVAFVPQQPHIPQGMSVAEYVALGRSKRDGWGNESTASRLFISSILEQTNLYGMQRQPVTQLSGGEMQRTLIARALAQEPELILLDEPTSALDLHHQIDVLNNLQILQAQGVTIISTMHDITLAAMYAERIIVMREGRVLVDGPSESIIHSPQLKAAFDDRINVFTLDSGRPVVVARKDELER